MIKIVSRKQWLVSKWCTENGRKYSENPESLERAFCGW